MPPKRMSGEPQHKPKIPLMSANNAIIVMPVGRAADVLDGADGGSSVGAGVIGTGTGSAGSVDGVGVVVSLSDIYYPFR